MKITKIASVALASTMLLGTTACKGLGGGTSVDNTVESTTELKIMVINKGYGTSWATEMEAAFEADNPGVNVDVKIVSDAAAVATSIEGGPKLNDIDIYFNVEGAGVQSKYESYKDKWGYTQGLMDYTEIYNSTIPGENVTMKEKMIDSFLKASTITEGDLEKQYSMSWASGMMGMFYNKDVLARVYPNGYQLPQTTDDFIKMLGDVKAKAGYTAITYPGKLDQLVKAFGFAFWAQYEGLDGVDNFYSGKVYNEDTESYELSSNIFKQQGIYESLKVLETIASEENGYAMPEVLSYDGSNFRNLQLKFFTSSQNIAFYPCGDWLEQESSFQGSSEVGLLPTPVISSIINVLDTVNSEAELKEVISYVDGDTTTIDSKYSAADIERVREARNIRFSNSDCHYAYSPAYANAPQLIKSFLLYMASDKGIEIYKRNVKGSFLPFEYDYSSMSGLSSVETDIAKSINTVEMVYQYGHTRMTYVGGVGVFGGLQSTVDYALSANKNNSFYMNAEDIWKAGFYTDAEWQNVLQLVG